MIRRLFDLALIAAVMAVFPVSAAAQDWPVKQVLFIVPFPPGGSVDQLARLVGVRLTDWFKQRFTVETKPGASGSIGAAYVARSPADGYTFLFVFDTHAVNPAIMPNLPFDTAKDFVPVMLVGTSPNAIVTSAFKPYRNFADIISAARAKPDTVTFGSIGNGSLGHLTMILVQEAVGIRLIHVPYKGGPPMMQDAMGGQIELGIASVPILTPFVKGGKLRGIAVTGDKRSQAMPDVPALAEHGFKGFSALAWWGIFAPAGTPKPILDSFHAALEKVFNQPDVRKTLTETLGMDLQASSPEALQKWLTDEMSRWSAVVKQYDVQPK